MNIYLYYDDKKHENEKYVKELWRSQGKEAIERDVLIKVKHKSDIKLLKDHINMDDTSCLDLLEFNSPPFWDVSLNKYRNKCSKGYGEYMSYFNSNKVIVIKLFEKYIVQEKKEEDEKRYFFKSMWHLLLKEKTYGLLCGISLSCLSMALIINIFFK